ncbi:MAG: hypothetical protein HQK50_04845 [Oligoflexia bacterium]|nr:hypothetical protein [Oligoflexia bacterium]MBF0364874.1 hypothetical protein [Oligoflexia bacterium]
MFELLFPVLRQIVVILFLYIIAGRAFALPGSSDSGCENSQLDVRLGSFSVDAGKIKEELCVNYPSAEKLKERNRIWGKMIDEKDAAIDKKQKEDPLFARALQSVDFDENSSDSNYVDQVIQKLSEEIDKKYQQELAKLESDCNKI